MQEQRERKKNAFSLSHAKYTNTNCKGKWDGGKKELKLSGERAQEEKKTLEMVSSMNELDMCTEKMCVFAMCIRCGCVFA